MCNVTLFGFAQFFSNSKYAKMMALQVFSFQKKEKKKKN